MRFSIEATVNFPDEESDTPQSTGLTRAQVHVWLDKLLDTEPDMTSCVIILTKEAQ